MEDVDEGGKRVRRGAIILISEGPPRPLGPCPALPQSHQGDPTDVGGRV